MQRRIQLILNKLVTISFKLRFLISAVRPAYILVFTKFGSSKAASLSTIFKNGTKHFDSTGPSQQNSRFSGSWKNAATFLMLRMMVMIFILLLYIISKTRCMFQTNLFEMALQFLLNPLHMGLKQNLLSQVKSAIKSFIQNINISTIQCNQ